MSLSGSVWLPSILVYHWSSCIFFKYFSQCSQDMVTSFYRGAHLTRQREVKIIHSTHFTHSNAHLWNCDSMCPDPPTCWKLALFLILSGTPGARVDGGGVNSKRNWTLALCGAALDGGDRWQRTFLQSKRNGCFCSSWQCLRYWGCQICRTLP